MPQAWPLLRPEGAYGEQRVIVDGQVRGRAAGARRRRLLDRRPCEANWRAGRGVAAEEAASARSVSIDMRGVREFDTFGAWMLERLTREWAAAGRKPRSRPARARPRLARRDERREPRACAASAPKSNRLVAGLASVGRAAVGCRTRPARSSPTCSAPSASPPCA